MSIDEKIRYVGICDESGDTKYGGQREGVIDIITPEDRRKSNLHALARWALRDALSDKTGKGLYAMAEYEKIKRITMPIDSDHLLLITTEVSADHARIIDAVLKLLGRFP